MNTDPRRSYVSFCNGCDEASPSEAWMEVHVLLRHPRSEEALVYLLSATVRPLHVPRAW